VYKIKFLPSGAYIIVEKLENKCVCVCVEIKGGICDDEFGRRWDGR
jgi:hypothetical protein